MEEHLQRQREENLAALALLGLPFLPRRYSGTRSSEEIKGAYQALEGSCVRIAGRLMRERVMGKASFAHIQDSAGQIQAYFKADELGESRYQYFKLLDLGDLVGIEGTVFTTRTGEVTIQARDIVLLAKAFRPPPEKWHGLTDVETRYRHRYLDLMSNDETRRVFRLRSAVVRAIRQYLDTLGFVEVETPILQPMYGGAAANPFVTRYRSLDMDAYLRIATELYLKRLIIGGIDRVYEIGKDFRNEGFSRKNSPEFTMLEFYQAYADYGDVMTLFESMISNVCQETRGTQSIQFDGYEIDFSPPWRRITVAEALAEYAGVALTADTTRDELMAVAAQREVHLDPSATRGKVLDELVSTLVEPNLVQPTFLCDFPVDFPGSLLAKRREDDPGIVERFEVYIGAMELANAFTELNEPQDQRVRMEEAAALTGEEHAAIDEDFIRALEHGMPPTGGLGFGIDRLVMILTDSHQIRETILFPLLRPREDDDAQP